MLIDVMNDHGLEQLVRFPTREKNTLDFLLTSLPSQFQEIHLPDKLSDHDVISGTFISTLAPPPPPKKKKEKKKRGRCFCKKGKF